MMTASPEKAKSLSQAMNENDNYEKRDQDVLKLDMNRRYPNGCDRYRLRVSRDNLIIKEVFGVAMWCYNQAVYMVFRRKVIPLTKQKFR